MPAETPPAVVELRPGLTAAVHAREVTRPDGRFGCWTYLTDGLFARGQKEIALTLMRPPERPEEGFPHMVLELLAMIGDLSAQGRIVDVGDYTEFGDTGFLGNPDLRGLLYLPYQPIPGLQPGGPALTTILVPGDELEVAKACGVTRVMARLGQVSSHFPCPDWSDPQRSAVVSATEIGRSVLARMPTIALGAASVTRRDDDVSLELTREVQRRLGPQLEALHPKHPLALLTGLPPDADALLAWQPDQQGPMGISAPGSSGDVIAGCFCAFVPKQPADDAQVFEDGFVLMLTKRSWRRVRAALTAGEDLDLPPGPWGLGFSVRTLDA
jgi:hypothetical protein